MVGDINALFLVPRKLSANVVLQRHMYKKATIFSFISVNMCRFGGEFHDVSVYQSTVSKACTADASRAPALRVSADSIVIAMAKQTNPKFFTLIN